jgi:hypothetical protein
MKREFLLVLLLLPFSALAQDSRVEFEIGPAWQSKNEVQIPNPEGDRFNLSDFSSGAELSYRVTAEHTFAERHIVRMIVAPLAFRQSGEFEAPVRFDDQRFDANRATDTSYRFNSYRLGYRYAVLPDGPFRLLAGGTLKVRDAKVRVSQGDLSESYSNVGVVPLLSAQFSYVPSERLSLLLDVEGLGAPQGRAIDALLGARYQMNEQLDFTVGYRMLEGGADNDDVYTFSWIHYAVASVGFRF